jgi:hypothetical protein
VGQRQEAVAPRRAPILDRYNEISLLLASRWTTTDAEAVRRDGPAAGPDRGRERWELDREIEIAMDA